MNIQNQIEYIARDYERQNIPWVRMTDRSSGRSIVYRDQNNPLTTEELAAAEIRTVDCMDCHNRPSHIYYSPDYAVDVALLTNRIDQSLPYIKEKAVSVMAKVYQTESEALQAIANEITDYYQTEYPDVFASRRASIDASVAAIQEAFSQSIFPEMKVRWDRGQERFGFLSRQSL